MPKAVALILTTIALDALVQSIAVGIAFFVLLRAFALRLSPRMAAVALFVCFAALDLLWWPAAAASSASVTLQDADLARFFEVAPDTPVSALASLGVTDWVAWFLQTAIALWVANRLGLIPTRRAA